MKKEIEKLPEEAYTVLDRLDEKEIARELAGLIEYGAQELIYSFKIEGRDITGLSWPGAKALARWMAEKGHSLDAAEKDITQDEDSWYADVKVVDKATGLGLWGTSKARKMKQIHVVDSNRNWVKNKDGSWKFVEKPDEHSRTIALNKAQRNAICAHVPDKMIAQFIKQATEEGRVRHVPPNEVESHRPRKQVDSKEVKQIREQARRDREERLRGISQGQLRLGQITANVIVYNLKTIGVGEEVSVTEQENGFHITPVRKLDDDDWYPIQHTLEPMGAEWLEDKKRWVIWKEPEDR